MRASRIIETIHSLPGNAESTGHVGFFGFCNWQMQIASRVSTCISPSAFVVRVPPCSTLEIEKPPALREELGVPTSLVLGLC